MGAFEAKLYAGFGDAQPAGGLFELARKFAYQALLIEGFTRAGTRVEFVKGPRGDSPEDQLLVQFLRRGRRLPSVWGDGSVRRHGEHAASGCPSETGRDAD